MLRRRHKSYEVIPNARSERHSSCRLASHLRSGEVSPDGRRFSVIIFSWARNRKWGKCARGMFMPFLLLERMFLSLPGRPSRSPPTHPTTHPPYLVFLIIILFPFSFFLFFSSSFPGRFLRHCGSELSSSVRGIRTLRVIRIKVAICRAKSPSA